MQNNNERLSFNIDHVENLKSELGRECAELLQQNIEDLLEDIHECIDPGIYGMLIAVTVMTDMNDERVEFREEIRKAAVDHFSSYLAEEIGARGWAQRQEEEAAEARAKED